MDANEIKNTAEVIFRRVFRRPDLVISREMKAADVSGWDSLAHITLITEIEEKFKIRFATREVMAFKNVGDLLDTIDRRLHTYKPG